MILLKNVRLINWYGFSNITAPIGFFTLIAGKNGNGKSVMLDAIKYAAYGDTVFNKSSDSKGARTLPSYTRGLLDATAKTYMRPAEKMPNIYSHIALEYDDDVLQKKFVLGVIIETNVADNTQSYRYVIDKKGLTEVEHLYKEDGMNKPYSGDEFQKKYGITLMNKENGISKFMQMTGLKLNLGQTNTYLRKLRGIMTYDPEAKIDKFIKESVLEDKKVDFSKLIEARENIGKLNRTFDQIQAEIEELAKIIDEYDGYESEKNRLLIDDIKMVYKTIIELKEEIKRQRQEKTLAENQKAEAEKALKFIAEKENETDKKIREVTLSLDQMDCMEPIRQEEEHLTKLQDEKEVLIKEKRKLEEFQIKVSEILDVVFTRGRKVENKSILASLAGNEFSFAEKESTVHILKQLIMEEYEKIIKELADIDKQAEEVEHGICQQLRILEDCKRNRNAYNQIQEYVNLKNEINREFEKRGLQSEAKFACEYVLALKDESWRESIESFLGRRRYSILVEPEYYDIADNVLNNSSNKYAHLFNTKLLMKKKVDTEEDSIVQFLSIKNPVAQRYFNYQLGRIKAVNLNEVKNYENAISKEGRVSIGMDSYFLRFDRIQYYYLGQETFELNRIRAEKEIGKLKQAKKEILDQRYILEQNKNQLKDSRDYFKDYIYDAFQRYQMVCTQIKESEQILKKLREAQKENREYMELSQLKYELEERSNLIKKEREEKSSAKGRLDTQIETCISKIEEQFSKLASAENSYSEYQITEYAAVQKATEAYDKFISNGSIGLGGLIAGETRRRIRDGIEKHKKDLLVLQGEYNGKRQEESKLPTGIEYRKSYEKRKSQIWMDDLQEVQEKLNEQTRRYEDIFKNEFVLTILKSCDKAMDDLKLINAELAKLKFSTKYQFDVNLVKDASEYAKVIEYAKYLDEREQLGGTKGQAVFSMFTVYSDEDAERLEKDIKDIINGIINKNKDEAIEKFADYRNYMTYEILINNDTFRNAKLSKQTGYNSGAEVQIPYLLILASALLLIYNEKVNSTRLVFIDEPFAKMDPGNVKLMLNFLRHQKLQIIFCSPDKTESIGCECEVILPALKVRPDNMQLGIVQFHEDKKYGRL